MTLHTVTFQPGSVSTSLHVTADLDAVAETSDSLIAVVYTVPSSTYTVGSSTEASVTITDTAPVVTIAADQTTVAEGDTATYTLTRTRIHEESPGGERNRVRPRIVPAGQPLAVRPRSALDCDIPYRLPHHDDIA